MNRLGLVFILCTVYGTLVGENVKDLRSAQTLPLSSILTSASVAVFFAPNCMPCARQLKDLACLADRAVVFGMDGSESALANDLRRAGFAGRAYYATSDVLSAVGIQPIGSPQIVFLQAGKVTAKHLGYLNCHTLQVRSAGTKGKPQKS